MLLSVESLLRIPNINVNHQRQIGNRFLGWIALHLAYYYNDDNALKTLLQHNKIEVNLTNSNGQTAIFAAVLSLATDCLEIMLVDQRVDLYVKDKDGHTIEDLVGDICNKKSIHYDSNFVKFIASEGLNNFDKKFPLKMVKAEKERREKLNSVPENN